VSASAAAATDVSGADAVRRSEERLRLVLEATGAGIWDTHLGTGETYISERLEEILGYPPGGCPRTLATFVRHVTPVHRPRVIDMLRESIRTRAPFIIDCTIRDARGAIRSLHVRGDVLADAQGRAQRSFGTVVDVTAEMAAQQERLAQERELARAQRIARLGSWTWDFHRKQLSWSAELYNLMGLDPATTPPSEAAIDALMPEVDRQRLKDAHGRFLTHGDPVDERFTLRRPDGTVCVMHALAEVLRDADGSPIALVGTMQDITDDVREAEERARLEAQVHQTQKLESLGLLAGGIAHDFNNLLVGVLSNASLALLDIGDDSMARPVVLEIERTAQRAADLTRQLLAYSGKGRFVVEPLDLSALALEMSQLLRTVVSKNATLQLELDEALPMIQGDATQLRQVIMNLITNASDALQGRSGVIRVRTTRLPDPPLAPGTLRFGERESFEERVCLEVSDTGEGMTRDTAERIFDPFFSTKFTGRGLGLAATLGIVRGHHGEIMVESAPQRGSRFVLCFPATHAPAPAADQPAPRETPPQRGLALVVDDDGVVRSVTAALLARQGFDVETVSCGQDALDRLAHSEPPVRFVLLDLTMPGLSGIEVLEQLRARERDLGAEQTTVFLMSGYSELDVTGGLGQLPISGFLQKPFTIADLVDLLAELPDA
jgi:PAS domain S-box-containing protein